MAKTSYATDDEIIEALQATKGIITLACSWLLKNKGIRITRQTIHRRINKSKKVADARKEIDEATLDFAEGKLLQLLNEGDKTALIFYLKTKGKARGYTERQELTGKDGKELNAPKSDVVIVRLPDNGRGDNE